MKSTICLLSLFILVAAINGCGISATYQIKSKTQLQEQQLGKGRIRALTVDSRLYTLNTFTFTDSLLSGSGTLKKKGLTTPFDGSIPFNHIVFIEGLETTSSKGLWVVPMMVVVASGLAAALAPPMFTIIPPSSGSGSCPYVYAFGGKQFKLEAEAFGTSVSKSLEAQTFSILPSLAPVDGLLNVRVSNERPETHLLNSVHLFVADAGDTSSVVLDINNVLWQLLHPIPPSVASNHSGKNILNDIVNKDKCYWKSELTNTRPNTGFRDTLELQFDVPQGASEATLVVNAINTELINEVYSYMGSVLGDATLLFYQAMENDSELQRTIKDWICECSLKIEVSDGSNWNEAGMMPPEANVAAFSRAIRISNLGGIRGPLRVRLSTLTDVWRLDAVSIDFSPVQPLPLHPLEMNSVSASDNKKWEDAVKSSDSSYALILPPNYLDIQFNSAAALGMKKPVYLFAAQGYLYEWFPTQKESSTPFITETMEGADRIVMLKNLIKQKEFFLPPIYSGWRKSNVVEKGR